jgi:cytochrome c peroxidase
MRFVILMIGLVLCVGVWMHSCAKKKNNVALIHGQVSNSLVALSDWYEREWQLLLQSGNEEQLQQSFLKGRQLYKKEEWAIEYFFAVTAKELNGPPVPEIEAAEHLVFPASGFGVMETFIFPFKEENRTALIQESKKWKSVLFRLQTLWAGHRFRDDQVWDAAHLQLLRITALGLSNFDTPLSFASINEIEAALAGVEAALLHYGNNEKEKKMFQKAFADAYAFLQVPQPFDLFDRMHFIQQHLQPIGRQLVQVQKKLQIPFSVIHAVRGSAATYFDSAAFQPNFFTPSQLSYINDDKVALGGQLFSDAILSRNDVACASCHYADKAFTDGLTKSRSFGADSFLPRNTPTLLYAGLQQSQFYDMRATQLEDQVKNVIHSKDEMHSSLGEAVENIRSDSGYVKMFQNAFNDGGEAVTEYKLQAALAAYVRSLAPFTSRFDSHMRKGNGLNGDEIKGFNLFMGKAKCGSCHFMPLFNGTVPPQFTKTESEVIGVPADAAFTKVDGDNGRYDIYQIEEWKGAFKTPTLRNVARTAPYMHNGVYKTLEEVIHFYNEGGATGRNIHLPNQTLPPEKLNLSKEEMAQVILFLQTLTDAP